jgi:cupin 2 domain-containing protein
LAITITNLHAVGAPPTEGERFVELARIGGTTIETIVSSAEPDTQPYDQPHDEWVVLLEGTAELEVAGERTSLVAGDSLLLPAHTPHRLLATSAGARWLAVHVR